MHDINRLRADPAAFDAAMQRRGLAPMAASLVDADTARRAATTALQDAQSRRNALAQQIGRGKREKIDTSVLEQEAGGLRGQIEHLEQTARQADGHVKLLLETLPNRLDDDVPDGRDETQNVVHSQFGEPTVFSFAAKQHFELGEALGEMDFAIAAKLAGARFTVLRGSLARLERALGQFMLDLHIREHGYQEVSPPLMVNGNAMFGVGQLPKFTEDLFQTTDGRWLIPTAEVPLTYQVGEEITSIGALPLRYCALTECFRSEAGSAGRDTRGMLRQHQFRKVELVSVTTEDQSSEEHERMTACAETVLKKLDLPFRRVVLCAGDTGFSAAKTYDLEVWLPGQQAWREISSCSNTRDFQARRMNARIRGADGKSLSFAHTLNGSGVAVGRAMIAVMENYQQADGSIQVPEILRPYMGGIQHIGRG